MKRRLVRFWYVFKNWFRTKPGQGEPLTFLCGSEKELRRVTTWACHVNPDIFAKVVAVQFEYTVPYKARKGFIYVFSTGRQITPDVEGCPRSYLDRWGELILKHNQFTGTQWEPIIIIGPRCPLLIDRIFPNFPSYPVYVESPERIVVRVHPSSAHERAEALLALSEWLDGKVSEQEKRELLQLPDDMEV